jgi:hypothetical protein
MIKVMCPKCQKIVSVLNEAFEVYHRCPYNKNVSVQFVVVKEVSSGRETGAA